MERTGSPDGGQDPNSRPYKRPTTHSDIRPADVNRPELFARHRDVERKLRVDARNGALEMVKLGLTSDQLSKMASA